MIQKIVIGTLELTPENGYYVQGIRDLGYSTKYASASLVYMHGVKLGDVYFQNKAIGVELVIGGATQSEFITRRSDLYKALTVSEYSSDLITIDFYLSNGIILQASGVIKTTTSDVSTETLVTGKLAFVIETEKPFLLSKTEYRNIFGIHSGGGFAIPMTLPLNMAAGAVGYTSIDNGGNVFSFPTIKFSGPLTNPVLTETVSGESIALAATITTGHYYSIDTYNRTIIDDTGANKRDKLTGNFLVLNSGENRFRLQTDNSSEIGTVEIIYKYAYISI